MEKLTYKEFDEEMKNIGLRTQENDLNVSVYSDKALVAAVNKSVVGMMTTYYGSFEWLDQIDRYVLTMACHKLTMTYPEDRVEPKRYYLKVKPEYQVFFKDKYVHLKVSTYSGDPLVRPCEHDGATQLIFTEEEIEELNKKYDLSLFERVEVEDD